MDLSHLKSVMQSWHIGADGLSHGLPADAYTNADFWLTERKSIFAKQWVLAGFMHELPNVGDVVPTTVAGMPLLMVKNETDKIGVFHNVCRHRCLQLVDEAKNVGKMIRCPYHAWAYHLDGTLRFSPQFGGIGQNKPPGFEPNRFGLVSVRMAIWHDWIFVNIDGSAPDFESYCTPLKKRLQGIDFSLVKPVATLDFGSVKTNWKFIMENFIEPYHVQFVHTSTTNQPLKDHSTILDDVCLGSAVDLQNENKGGSSLAVSSRYLTLFPNFIIGRYFPDQLGVYQNTPIDAYHTLQRRVIYTTDGNELSLSEIEDTKNLWWKVHKEDHAICERLQLGRQSPVADSGGLLSPHWEDSVRAFHKLIMQAISTEVSNTTN